MLPRTGNLSIDPVSDLFEPSTFVEVSSRATEQISDRQRKNFAALERPLQQLIEGVRTTVLLHVQMLPETASGVATKLQSRQPSANDTDWSHGPHTLGDTVCRVHAERLPDVV